MSNSYFARTAATEMRFDTPASGNPASWDGTSAHLEDRGGETVRLGNGIPVLESRIHCQPEVDVCRSDGILQIQYAHLI